MAGVGSKSTVDGAGDTMSLRFVPRGRPGIPNSTIRYSDLTQNVKDKIAETDPTEHELLEMIVIQIKINNLHLMKLSNVNIDEVDVDWP